MKLESAIGAGVGILIVVAVGVAAKLPRATQQKVVGFEPLHLQLGRVAQDDLIKSTFKLTNRGTNEVRILGLRSTCKCTLVRNSAGEIILPGSSMVIPIEFRSGREQGPAGGRIEALFEIQGKRYYAWAGVDAYVETELLVEPHSLEFGNVAAGSQTSRIVRFMSTKGNLAVLSIGPTSNLKVCLTNITGSPSSNEQDLAVTLDAPLVRSTRCLIGKIDVQTSSKGLPVITIPFIATLKPQVEIAPEVIVLNTPDWSGETRFTIETSAESRISRVTVDSGSSLTTDTNAANATTGGNDPKSLQDDWGVKHVRREAKRNAPRLAAFPLG